MTTTYITACGFDVSDEALMELAEMLDAADWLDDELDPALMEYVSVTCADVAYAEEYDPVVELACAVAVGGGSR